MKGDGNCHDSLNTELCNFDGGDCCNEDSYFGYPYCTRCECLELPLVANETLQNNLTMIGGNLTTLNESIAEIDPIPVKGIYDRLPLFMLPESYLSIICSCGLPSHCFIFDIFLLILANRKSIMRKSQHEFCSFTIQATRKLDNSKRILIYCKLLEPTYHINTLTSVPGRIN